MWPDFSQACRRLREYCGNRRASAWSRRRPPSAGGTRRRHRRGEAASQSAYRRSAPTLSAIIFFPHARIAVYFLRSSRLAASPAAARQRRRRDHRLVGAAPLRRGEGRHGVDKDWPKAIKYLEKLEARYPYGRFAQQAQLEVAYCHCKDGERASAIAAADRFIKLYPNHANVDYA